MNRQERKAGLMLRIARAIAHQLALIAVALVLCFAVSVIAFVARVSERGGLVGTHRAAGTTWLIDVECWTWLGGSVHDAGYSGALWGVGAAAHMPPMDESIYPSLQLARHLDGDVPMETWYRYLRRVFTMGVPFHAWVGLWPNANPGWLNGGIDLNPVYPNVRIPLRPMWGPFLANLGVWYSLLVATLGARRGVRGWRRRSASCCHQCGYSLVGLGSDRCPECGGTRE